VSIARAMSPVLHPYPPELEEIDRTQLHFGALGHQDVDGRDAGSSDYRCPCCGMRERTDSTIPGTCPLCPGLVGLEAR
jgi:rubrerythrin